MSHKVWVSSFGIWTCPLDGTIWCPQKWLAMEHPRTKWRFSPPRKPSINPGNYFVDLPNTPTKIVKTCKIDWVKHNLKGTHGGSRYTMAYPNSKTWFSGNASRLGKPHTISWFCFFRWFSGKFNKTTYGAGFCSPLDDHISVSYSFT